MCQKKVSFLEKIDLHRDPLLLYTEILLTQLLSRKLSLKTVLVAVMVICVSEYGQFNMIVSKARLWFQR